VFLEVFGGRRRVERGLEEVRGKILSLLEGEILEKREVGFSKYLNIEK